MKRHQRIAIMLLIAALMVSSMACGSTAPASSPSQSAAQATSAGVTATPAGTAETAASTTETASGAASSATPLTKEDLSTLPDIVFTVFIPDPNTKTAPDDSPVLDQVYKATKVHLKIIVPPAEPRERLNIMLATDDLPDLIRFDDVSIMNQFIQSNKLLKINDLMATFAPNAFNVNWAAFKENIKDKDGNLWYMPGYYSFGSVDTLFPETDSGFIMRTGLLEEKGWFDPKTFDDYYNLIKEAQTKYPGMKPMALALGPLGHLDSLNGIAAGAYGLTFDSNTVLTDDGKLAYFTDVPQIKEFYQFLNKLSREGLMDKESPIMSSEMLKTKVVGKKVWSFIGPGWEIASEVIAYEAEKGSTEQMKYFFPKANTGIGQTAYARYTQNLYTTGMALTIKNKDPERYMKFYEYLNSEEGWFKQLGIVNFDFKGANSVENTENYDFVNSGKEFIPGRPFIEASAWMTKSWGDDENWWVNRGINYLWDYTYGEANYYPNGKWDYVGKMDVGIWWDENTTRINKAFGWTGANYYQKQRDMSADISLISSLPILPESDEYGIEVKINEYLKTQLPKIIIAKDEAEFIRLWEEMLSKTKTDGIGKVMALRSQLYEERKAAFGK